MSIIFGINMSMTNLSRLNDIGTGTCPTPGHGAYTTVYVSGATTVFTNNLPQMIVGTIGKQSCGHSSTALSGSPTVFAENKPVHRINDIGVGGAGDTYVSVSASGDTEAGG